MKVTLIMLVASFLCLLTCESELHIALSKHTIIIYNSYQSNGHDNYDDQIEINFKLEYLDWMWIYPMGNRVSIYSDSYDIFNFALPPEENSIYINARFWYMKGPQYLAVQADTTIKLDHDVRLIFTNCSDSTDVEYPFTVCWETEMRK